MVGGAGVWWGGAGMQLDGEGVGGVFSSGWGRTCV